MGKRPLVLMTCGLIGGILIEKYMWISFGCLCVTAGICFATAAICMVILRSRIPSVLVVLLMVVIGALAFQREWDPPVSSIHLVNYVSSNPLRLAGVVREESEPTGEGATFLLDVKTVEGKSGQMEPVEGMAQITVRKGALFLDKGDMVFLMTRLRAIQSFGNPGEFDRIGYMKSRGILVTGFVADASQILVYTANGKREPTLRQEMFIQISRHMGSEEGAVILAMFTNLTRMIPPPLREAFSRTGTAHILAISGLHLTMLAAWMFFIFKFIWERSLHLLAIVASRKVAAILTSVVIILFTQFVGAPASALRSCVMAIAFLIGIILERDYDILSSVALSGLILLLYHPSWLFEPSFQMSYSAVLAIVGYVPPMVDWMKRRLENRTLSPRLRRIIYYLGSMATISIAATLGTMPSQMAHFHMFSSHGVLVNLVAVPYSSFLIMPYGFVCLALEPLHLPFYHYLLNGLSFVTRIFIHLIRMAEGIPFYFDVPQPGIFGIALMMCFLYCLYRLLKSHRMNRRRALILFWISLCFVVGHHGWQWTLPWFQKDLRVTMLSVGDGDCTLVRFPGGPVMMIDGGGFEGSDYDVGAAVIKPALLELGITRVDIIVLSHPHADHLLGLRTIIEEFHVQEAWIALHHRAEGKDDTVFRSFIQRLNALHIPIVDPAAEKRDVDIGGVSIRAFYAPYRLIHGNMNNTSMVLRLEYENVRLLLAGDIEKEAEDLMLDGNYPIQADILKVAHHGSSSSSSSRFLYAVHPRVAVISCSTDGRHRFPSSSVLARLKAQGIDIWQTNKRGAVFITIHDGRWEIESFR